MQQPASDVVAKWLHSDVLKQRGGRGKIATTKPGKKANRVDLVEHEEVLIPVLEHVGPKVNIDVMQEYCREFMWKTRPRGKKDPTSAPLKLQFFMWPGCLFCYCCFHFRNFFCGGYCLGGETRKEAWKVRRLLSAFTRVARRPHWPREKAMQRIFEAAGIQKPARGSQAKH